MLAERNGKGGRQSRYCLAVEMAQKQSIWHYQPLKSCTFLRIVVATPNLVTQARSEWLAANGTIHMMIEMRVMSTSGGLSCARRFPLEHKMQSLKAVHGPTRLKQAQLHHAVQAWQLGMQLCTHSL